MWYSHVVSHAVQLCGTAMQYSYAVQPYTVSTSLATTLTGSKQVSTHVCCTTQREKLVLFQAFINCLLLYIKLCEGLDCMQGPESRVLGFANMWPAGC
jgi:hypothetical protein